MSNTLKKFSSVVLSATTTIWLSGAMMIAPAAANAQSVSDLQAQIQALLAQIALLQSQISGVTTGSGAGAGVACSFTRDLTMGSQGDDVKCLQDYLTSTGHFTFSGGSTGYFGSVTRSALAAWQAANGVSPAAGYFGPISKAKYSSLASAGTGTGTGTGTQPPVVVPGSAVNVAVDGPASAVIPDGSVENKVMKLRFTAGSSAASITGVTVTRGGFVANTNITGLSLFDDAGNRYGNVITALTSDGKATISFSGNPFVVAAGQSRNLTLAVNLSASTDNGTVSFSVASASDITTTNTVQGNFPLVGSTFSIVDGAASLGDARVDDQSVSGLTYSTISSATGNFEIGDTNREVFKLRVTQNNSKEAIRLEKLTVYAEGTIQESTDVKNWKLYSPEGVLLASADMPVNRYVTFNLSSPYLIDKGLSKDFTVKVDIMDGSSRYFRVYVQNDYDIVLRGVTTGSTLLATDGSGNSLESADTQNASGGFKMKAGTLTVSRAPSSPSGNVAPSAQNIVLAKFDLKSSGEKLEIQKLGVQVKYAGVALTGSLTVRDAATQETYLSISADTSGLQSTSALTTTTLKTNQRSLSSYITLESNQSKTLEVVGTVASTATSTSNYTVSVGEFYTKRFSTVDFTDLAETKVDGSQLSVTDVTLTVTKSTAFANINRSKGATNVKIGEVVLQASAADDVRVNTISFDVTSSSDIQNLTLKNITAGGVQLGNTVGTPSASGNSFTVNLVVSKSQSVVLGIYADVLSSANTGDQITLTIPTGQVTGFGVASSKSLSSVPSGNTALQTITIQAPTLTVGLDANAQTTKIVLAGQTGVELSKIKFEAANENLSLKKITLALTTASSTQWNTTSGIAANFSKIYLFDGSTVLNPGGTDVVSGNVIISNINVSLSQDTAKVLTVKADVTGSGVLTPKSVGGIKIYSSSTSDMEVYSGQGLMSTGITLNNNNAASNNFLFTDAAPTIVNSYNLSTSRVADANDVIGRFTITNAGVRPITIASTSVLVSLGGSYSNTSSVNNFRLYDENDTLIETTAGYVSGTSTSATIVFDSFSPTQEISAGGSKTYVVKAATTNIRSNVTSGSSVNLVVKIDGAKGYLSTDVASSPSGEELLWSDGKVSYSYTSANTGTTYSNLNASDSGSVSGPTLTY